MDQFIRQRLEELAEQEDGEDRDGERQDQRGVGVQQANWLNAT